MEIRPFSESPKIIVMEMREDEARIVQHALARALPSAKTKIEMSAIKGIKKWFEDREEFYRKARLKID